MIERFDELTAPPVKGRVYLVRCVRAPWNGEDGVWPVWGAKHEDAKFIDFGWRHYHVNRFFIDPNRQLLACGHPVSEGFTGGPVRLPEPVLLRRICRTASPMPFPLEVSTVQPKWIEMYAHFAGTQSKRGNGWVCPHKGFDLGPIAPRLDGVIVCPLHGLRIDAQTGVVLP